MSPAPDLLFSFHQGKDETMSSSLTRDGRSWEPSYLVAIDPAHCIGCGRCFKVCGRGVMTLKGINEGGDVVDLEDDNEVERKVMVLLDQGNCVGSGACARVCPAKCQTHAAS
jgi:Nif-specific ferredoxin III